MTDIAVVGTAAADVVLRVDAVPKPGQHVSATSLGWRLGGGSANVASALAALGHRVSLVGPVGTDRMGTQLIEELVRRGVNTDRIDRVPEPTPRALILLDAEGERTIVGVDEPFSRRVYPRADVADLGRVDAVYVETFHRFPVAIADRAAAALLMTAPPHSGTGDWPANVIIGSEHDYPAAWLAGPYAAGREVAGPRLEWVVVTRGAKGADAYGPHGAAHADAPVTTQVDATGAGDALAAALLSALLGGRSIDEALAAGTEAGAKRAAGISSILPEAVEALEPEWPGD